MRSVYQNAESYGTSGRSHINVRTLRTPFLGGSEVTKRGSQESINDTESYGTPLSKYGIVRNFRIFRNDLHLVVDIYYERRGGSRIPVQMLNCTEHPNRNTESYGKSAFSQMICNWLRTFQTSYPLQIGCAQINTWKYKIYTSDMLKPTHNTC